VAAAGHAVDLLRGDDDHQPLLVEALGLLASHLLETRTGDRVANVARAAAIYQEIRSRSDVAPDAWVMATFGLANALLLDPAANPTGSAEALHLCDEVIDVAREGSNIPVLVRALGQKARIESGIRTGDVDAHLEHAILHQREAIFVLEESDFDDDDLLGRQWHNLGRFYLERRRGVPADNVDLAIDALRTALELRPPDVDPLGRARTLRALAIAYPRWSAPDSPEDTAEMGEEAAEEAERLEAEALSGTGPVAGWAMFERQRSALTVELPLDDYSPPDRLVWLEGAIANHRQAVQAIPPNTLAWAEWTGGLGRLLGRLPHLGIWDQVEEAYECFAEALLFADEEQHPRLRRDLLSRWGELCHEIGDFEGSLITYRGAADLGRALFDQTADPENRWIELKLNRGYSLFAAFAAVRLGRPQEAAALAEFGRARLAADLFVAADAARNAPPDKRDQILAAVDGIRRLETALRDLGQDDLLALQRKLADLTGAPPEIFQVRGLAGRDENAGERSRLGDGLATARQSLGELLAEDPSTGSRLPWTFGFDDIAAAARHADLAVVYLMATSHGAAAVVVMPDGRCESAPFDDLDSSIVGGLVFGTDEVPGFVGALRGLDHGLDESLEEIAWMLDATLMTPLADWLESLGATRAALIPLGRLGLLPLHLATVPGITYSYAPCALALARAAVASEPMDPGRAVIVANPSSASHEGLPLAVAEGRGIQALVGGNRLCTGADADLLHVQEAAPDATLLHFAGHAEFRPADPLESYLVLAGEDRLSLADIYAGRVDVSPVRLLVMAACRSGTVEFERAPDESVGFPAALMVGGVPTVVSTLWPVDDEAAMFFGLRFYELLVNDGLDPAQAVEAARSWLRGVTADELRGRIAWLRSLLTPEDSDADMALEEIDEDFLDEPSAVPYADLRYWGAFMVTGLHRG